MKKVLVADMEGCLAATVKQGIAEVCSNIDLIVTTRDAEAIKELEEQPIAVVAVGLRRPCADPLVLALRALVAQPRLGRLLLIGPEPSDFEWQSLDGSRVRFIGSMDDPGLMATILEADAGSLEPATFDDLEVLEIVRIAACGSSDAAVEISHDNTQGILAFEDGVLVHASTPVHEGDDAFFDMVLWRGGPVVQVPSNQRFLHLPNLASPAAEIVGEAYRFRQVLLGGEEEPEARSESTHANGEDWWARLARQRPRGVGVVVACSGECERDCCQKLARQLSTELQAPNPSLPTPSTRGPSFLRLHPNGGGLLTVTFVPSVARNGFLFETLARSSQAVVLCATNDRTREAWLEAVPAGIPVRKAEGDEPEQWRVIELLRLLAEESS